MEHKCKKADVKPIEKCELNKEQIIKALECCTNFTPSSCDKCPFEPKGDCYKGSMGCNDELMKNALSIINELTEENERLRANNLTLAHELERVMVYHYKIHNKKLEDALESLKGVKSWGEEG